MKKKTIAGLMAFVLLIGAGVGVTLAYLNDKTEVVTNTFTVGKVDIDLYEHDLKENGELDPDKKVLGEDTYKIIPGNKQPKDPTVVVIADSEACWLFVKVVETNNTDVKYVDFAPAAGWKKLDSASTTAGTTVYYREVSASAQDQTFQVLAAKGDYTTGGVEYPATLTSAQIKALMKLENGKWVIDTNKQPKLEFTAYAVQTSDAIADAAAAWAQAEGASVDFTQTTN